MLTRFERCQRLASGRKPETWRQLLLDAADMVERMGLAKHAAMDSKGRVCAMAALCLASGETTQKRGPELSQAILVLENIVGDIVHWNNASARSAADVVTTMRRVAG